MIVLDMLIKLVKVSYLILISLTLLTVCILAEDENLIVEIDNPRFSEKGLDDKVYEIKAEKGLKSNNDLKLFTVKGKFKSEKEGKWIYLEADQGNFQQSSNFINLSDNIKFYTDDGEIIKSNIASFDMKNDIIKFLDKISHQNNEGLIIADSSIITKNFNKITYEGNVVTILTIGK